MGLSISNTSECPDYWLTPEEQVNDTISAYEASDIIFARQSEFSLKCQNPLDELEQAAPGTSITCPLALPEWEPLTCGTNFSIHYTTVDIDSTSEQIPAQNLTMRYVTAGNPDSLLGTIILLPGLGSNVLALTPFITSLAKSGFYVVAIDPPGFGESSWIHDADNNLVSTNSFDGMLPVTEAVTAGTAAVIRTLNLNNAILAGYSMGGALTQSILHRHTDLPISKAILIASAGTDGQILEPPIMLDLMAMAVDGSHEAMARSVAMTEFSIFDPAMTFMNSNFIGSDTRVRLETAAPYTYDANRPEISANVFANRFFAVDFADAAMQSPDLLAYQLEIQNSIDVPTLVIRIDNDSVIQEPMSQGLAKTISDSTYVVIEHPNGTHALPLTHPSPLTKVIFDYQIGFIPQTGIKTDELLLDTNAYQTTDDIFAPQCIEIPYLRYNSESPDLGYQADKFSTPLFADSDFECNSD
jgi:pimeloyl-ACP methyl ester carboxylesterase